MTKANDQLKALLKAHARPKQPSKYRATRTEVDGHMFASKKEAFRYCALKLLQQRGVIADLELQPKYDLIVNGLKICRYIGDFLYYDNEKQTMVWEDVKGVKTPAYVIKRNLMKAVHGIDITEV